jgi:Rrf2 family nitric oxide-sensitive transcriptional repressor
MQLTLHADYSLRVLLYLAENRERAVSTREISSAYQISRNHLVRVVASLHEHGFVKVTEGRGGGVKLARDPAAINLSQVVRATEPNFRIVECFEPETNTCPIVPACRLRGVLAKALDQFMAVLDECSLADIASKRGNISKYLQIESVSRGHDRGSQSVR